MKNLSACLLFLLSSFLLHAQKSDTLVLGYNIVPPFVMEEDGKLIGLSVWLWEKIADEHNIPYVYEYAPLDGLLTGVASGDLHLSLSPLTITHDRSKVMDFTSPYYITHATILKKKHSSLEHFFDFMKTMLSPNFFRGLGILAFVVLVFGFLVWIFERKHNKDEFGGHIHGLWSGFWWSAVTMTTVGYGDKSPKTLGGRIIALIWMFATIIIISGFTAGIASSLTVNRIYSSTGKIEDYKEWKLGTIANSGTDEWLRNNFFNKKKTFSNLDQMVLALKENQIKALAYDRPVLQYLLAADSLEDYELSDIDYDAQFYAFGVNKNLPHSMYDKINLSLLKITEEMEWRIVLSEFNLSIP